MPKSDTWPGDVAVESVSGMDSAESCDSVLSINSGFVSIKTFFDLLEYLKVTVHPKNNTHWLIHSFTDPYTTFQGHRNWTYPSFYSLTHHQVFPNLLLQLFYPWNLCIDLFHTIVFTSVMLRKRQKHYKGTIKVLYMMAWVWY